jgi:hypothetical protein
MIRLHLSPLHESSFPPTSQFTDSSLAFRFISWQRQLHLLPNDQNSWSSTWSTFSHTYFSLISSHSHHLNPSLTRTVRIDVVRLSRYFDSFSNVSDHIRRLERLLYFFSVSSSATGYRQGFHEILAPLYFVAIKGGPTFGLSLDDCEAIAYFLLHSLINGTVLGDCFMTEQQFSKVAEICEQAMKVLRICDSELAEEMDRNEVNLMVFAFKWVMVLFGQTYRLRELLRMWDLLFSELDQLEKNLVSLIVAQLMKLRRRLKGKKFGEMLKEVNGLEFDSEAESEIIRICWRLRRMMRSVRSVR